MRPILFDGVEDKWFLLPDKHYYDRDSDACENIDCEREDEAMRLLNLGERQAARYEPDVARSVGCAVLVVPALAAKLVIPPRSEAGASIYLKQLQCNRATRASALTPPLVAKVSGLIHRPPLVICIPKVIEEHHMLAVATALAPASPEARMERREGITRRRDIFMLPCRTVRADCCP